MDEPSVDKQPANANPFDGLNIMVANVALLCGAPFFLLCAILGELGRGVAAGICVGMIVLVIWMRWDLKNFTWFRTTIVVLVLLHVPLILLVNWSNKSYPRAALLPGALLDLFIVYRTVRLIEKAVRGGNRAGSPR